MSVRLSGAVSTRWSASEWRALGQQKGNRSEETGGTNGACKKWMGISFFRSWNPPTILPPRSLQSHLCNHTHMHYTTGSCSLYVQAAAATFFSVCSVFSQYWCWLGLGVPPILSFFCQTRCAAQHGPGSRATPSNKNTFLTGNTATVYGE